MSCRVFSYSIFAAAASSFLFFSPYCFILMLILVSVSLPSQTTKSSRTCSTPAGTASSSCARTSKRELCARIWRKSRSSTPVISSRSYRKVSTPLALKHPGAIRSLGPPCLALKHLGSPGLWGLSVGYCVSLPLPSTHTSTRWGADCSHTCATVTKTITIEQ